MAPSAEPVSIDKAVAFTVFLFSCEHLGAGVESTSVSSTKTFLLYEIIDSDIMEEPCTPTFCFNEMIEVLAYKNAYLLDTKRC